MDSRKLLALLYMANNTNWNLSCNNFEYVTHLFFSQAALDRLGKLKLACSNTKALKVKDVLGQNHDKILSENKTRTATKIKAIFDAELGYTSGGTCEKEPRVILSTCETCQLKMVKSTHILDSLPHLTILTFIWGEGKWSCLPKTLTFIVWIMRGCKTASHKIVSS